MPSKNSIKIYLENGYYHVYNRGVEKRIIFQDEQDNLVFLKNLKEHLSAPTPLTQGDSLWKMKRAPKNHSKEIDLIAYCLMPNHFHLLIKQNSKNAMESFMRSLATRYSLFFNKKYDRVGKLFQGPYKAVLITEENYLLHLSRYIHVNPQKYTKNLEEGYSSYADFVGIRKTDWLKPEIVLSFFNSEKNLNLSKSNTYKHFVETFRVDSKNFIQDLILEVE